MQIHKDPNKAIYAIGLMSGTSLDGIDAALLLTNGVNIERIGGSLTIPYAADFQHRLRGLLQGVGNETEIERELTVLHAEAVKALLAEEGMQAGDVDVVGFHGQTILHKPKQGITKQIGDGQLLAKLTGISVVCNFRSNDVKHGGQGAPLVPVYHQALMQQQSKPIAVVNIGGVANVTWLGDVGDLLAFDTGPGNALINDWVHQKIGAEHDTDGALAAKGRAGEAAIAAFLRHDFFSTKPPKSLDRNSFQISFDASLEDGAATLTMMTARSIAEAEKHFPQKVRQWIICGGGRHNPTLMSMLKQCVKSEVLAIEALGFNGDAIEAEAFAYLAVRSMRGLPLSFPETTGVSHAATGGVFYPA